MISALILAYASTAKSPLIQAVTLLVSMGLLFYSSHPLGHYLVARILGVGVDYFFLGSSDFKKLEMEPLRTIGKMIPTIGTKLNRSRLGSLAPRWRRFVFGAGVIFSNFLIGVQFAYALVAGFSSPAVLLSAAFVVGTLASEVVLSTKVGDISKMRGRAP